MRLGIVCFIFLHLAPVDGVEYFPPKVTITYVCLCFYFLEDLPMDMAFNTRGRQIELLVSRPPLSNAWCVNIPKFKTLFVCKIRKIVFS